MVVGSDPSLHAVSLGDSADVVRGGDGTSGRCLLLVVGKTLAGEVSRATLGHLEDDGGLDVAGERGVT